MKKIFDYIDYQEYMRDYYQEMKLESSFFSFRYMGQKLDLDAGFVAKVLQGKLHIALTSIPKVCALCKLSPQEAAYFDAMVKFGRAKNQTDIQLWFEKMLSLKGVDSSKIEEQQFRFYTKWYFTAIRSLLGYYRFKDNYEALAKKLSPPISVEEAQDAIALLRELNFIAQDEEGYFRITNTLITTGAAWKSQAIHSFQKETLTLARESLDRHPKELRDISTISIAISHEDLPEIRERIKAFRQSLLQMKTGNEKQDVVYQINIQAIPLTEIGDK